MIRTLLIIAGAALVLTLACLAGAAALGGHDLAKNGWAWTVNDGDGDHVRFERVRNGATDAPDVSRTIAWTGGDSLSIDGSLEVVYVQGAAANVVITGPQSAVDRVVVEGSRIALKDGEERVTFGFKPGGFEAWADSERLRIVVTAAAVNRFTVTGSDDLTIRNYDQDAIRIDIEGSGEVTAEGRARRLDLMIEGSGEARLAQLAVTDAGVVIDGSGEARIAPTGEADIRIEGSGDVDLATRPARVNRDVSGSGDINEL